ncbi:ParB N-terminal domain-containing protein [Candidatus Acetothermia bacterium]|nr:ParB N-terminal domain-containing protein [Candidatus Acetothermia bacterium]
MEKVSKATRFVQEVHATVREISVEQLRGHEETDPHRYEEVLKIIQDYGKLDVPIIVDSRSYVILDGHHRFKAYKELGLKLIPCVLVDYFSEHVQLFSRRSDIPVSKEEVINRALRGDLYPPKTTRHVFLDLPPLPNGSG